MVTDEATGQPQLKDGLPMVLLARQFESELDLSLAAAEAGAESESLAAVLRLVPDLGSQLGLLLVPGKTVKRDTYVAAFPLLTSVLRPPQLVKPISLALLSADGNSVAPRQSDPIMLSQLPPGATLRLQLLSITGDEQFPRSNEVPLQSPTTVAISLSMNSKPLIDEGWQNSEIERHTRPLLVLASLGQPDATRRHTVTVDAGVDIDKWEVASGTKTKFEPVRLVPIERTATTFARHVTPTALRKLAADLDKERHRELQTNEEEIAMLRDGLQRAATNKAGDTEALDDLQKKLLQKELVDRKRVEDESRKKQYTIRGAQLMSEFIQMILGPTTSAELRYRIFADFKGHRIVLATTETDDLVVPFIHKREP